MESKTGCTKYVSMLSSLCVFYFQLNYKDRVIRYQANGRVHSLQWVYDGRAWDVESAVNKIIDGLKAKGLVS